MINVFKSPFGEDQIQVVIGESLQCMLAGIGCSFPLDMPRGVTSAFKFWRDILVALILGNIIPDNCPPAICEPHDGAKGIEVLSNLLAPGTEENQRLMIACNRAEQVKIFIDLGSPESSAKPDGSPAKKHIDVKMKFLRGNHDHLFELWPTFELSSGKLENFVSIDKIQV